MKPWFIRIETFVIFLVIIALALKLLHISAADFLLMVSLFALAFLYLFLGTSARSNNNNKNFQPIRDDIELGKIESLFILAACLGMSVGIIGILFRQLHWEGFELQLMVGIFSGAACLIGSYFITRINQPILHAYIFARLLPVTVMCGVMLYLETYKV